MRSLPKQDIEWMKSTISALLIGRAKDHYNCTSASSKNARKTSAMLIPILVFTPPTLLFLFTNKSSYIQHQFFSPQYSLLSSNYLKRTHSPSPSVFIFTMSVVSLLGVKVLDNPAKFADSYHFEITFECLEQLQKGKLLIIILRFRRPT